MPASKSPVARLLALLRQEQTDITAIYFFAILNGAIQLSLPVGIQAIIGFVLGGTLSASLVVLITVLVAAVLFNGLLQLAQMRIIERIQQRIFVRYAFLFADRIPRLDLKQVDGYYLPELVNRFFDTVSLQKSFSKLLLDLPVALIQILFGLILLSFYHPFFILFGLLLLLLLWLILYFTGSKGLESSLAESSYKYGVAGWFEELARLANAFKFSTGGGLHLKKADEKTIGYVGARTRHFGVLLLQYKTLIGFKLAITAAMLIVGVILLLNQQINIGQFVAAEIIIITVIASVEKIIVNLDSVYDVLTAVEKINKLADKPVESSGSFPLQTQTPLGIEARGLSFGFDPDKPIISDLSFGAPPGQTLCITGPGGSGKSTLLKLIAGVYSDFEGALLINGVPIGNYDLASLRERTGILFLYEDVFQGTFWENITMGREVDAAHVAHLCRETGLTDFLASLPQGFDSELGPTGKRLPRNVVQKILVVRALAHRPQLVLLEEPWQGIESPHRQSIQKLLLSLPQTTVVVATNDTNFAGQCISTLRLNKISENTTS